MEVRDATRGPTMDRIGPNGTVSIESYRVRDLEPLAQRMADPNGPHRDTPCSRLRVRAWAHNPAADPDDVALLIATRGGRWIGYLALVPGRVRIGATAEKILWASNFFVAPSERSTGVGAMLIMRAMALGHHLGAVEFSSAVLPLFKTLRFVALGPMPYLTFQPFVFNMLRLPVRLVRLALGFFGLKWQPVERLYFKARLAWRPIAYAALRRWYSPRRMGIVLHEVDSFPENAFPVGHADPPRFERSRDEVEWTVRWPWITQDQSDATGQTYFRDRRDFIRYIRLVIADARTDAARAHLLLLVSADGDDVTVKVLDRELLAGGDARDIAVAALHYACQFQASLVLLPAVCEPGLNRMRLLDRFCRREYRWYMVKPRRGSNELVQVLNRVELRLADGDMAFG